MHLYDLHPNLSELLVWAIDPGSFSKAAMRLDAIQSSIR